MKATSIFKMHQTRIARSTLRMHDAGALIMGGMTKKEARAVLLKVHNGNIETYKRELIELEGDDSKADDR